MSSLPARLVASYQPSTENPDLRSMFALKPDRTAVRVLNTKNPRITRDFLRGERGDSNPRPPGPQLDPALSWRVVWSDVWLYCW
jgi:hypothetical protein